MPADCPVCLEEYDDQARLPRMLMKCGHSICSLCLERLIDYAAESLEVCCPKCRTAYLLPFRRKDQSIEGFPVIHDLKPERTSSARRYRKDDFCKEHERRLDFMCLDSACLQQRRSCFKCIKDLHYGCSSELLVDITPGRESVRQVPYNFDVDKMFELLCMKILSEFQDKIDSLVDKVDSYLESLSSFRVPEEDLDFKSGAFDFSSVTLEQSEGDRDLLIVPYNWLEFDRTVKTASMIDLLVTKKLERVVDECSEFLDATLEQLSRKKAHQMGSIGNNQESNRSPATKRVISEVLLPKPNLKKINLSLSDKP
jgi:hypothetical protein